MAASADEWSVNSNDAFNVSIVRSNAENDLTTLHEFNPNFTYPIFGEAEQIFGYKDLEIDLKFAAHNLRPNVEISFSKKFPAVGSTRALDVLKELRKFLPPVAFNNRSYKDLLASEQHASTWKPPGKLVKTYARKGKTYEIWAGSLLDSDMRELVDNIQIVILFFIEGGQFINLEDVDWTLDRWRVYLVYQKDNVSPDTNSSPYSFVGYATTYRFYRFLVPKKQQSLPRTDLSNLAAEISPKSLSSRLRISQFLILPPYQRGGHGSALYQAIYSEVMSDPTVTELTVEDPSEEFDKLRDINDFKTLKPEFEEAEIKINTTPFSTTERGRIKRVPTSTLLSTNTLQAVRAKNKIASRQFARQVEMFLLAQIGFSHRAAGGASLTTLKIRGAKASSADDRSYYWWRLLLKQRILKKNKDLLSQLALEDRLPQIEDSARGQEDEYEGLLMMYAVNQEKEAERYGNGTTSVGVPSASRKRKVIGDDDEDSDESSGSKRPRA